MKDIKSIDIGQLRSEIRIEVLEFALEMERRLRAKDSERGSSWKEETSDHLFTCLLDQVEELEFACKDLAPACQKKAIDVANLAMMVWDVSR